MITELYIDYAIKLLEAAKRKKSRKRKRKDYKNLNEGIWDIFGKIKNLPKNLKSAFTRPNIEWEKVLGKTLDNFKKDLQDKVREFLNDTGSIMLGREIVDEVKLNFDKLGNETDGELKQYKLLRNISFVYKALGKAHKECLKGKRTSSTYYHYDFHDQKTGHKYSAAISTCSEIGKAYNELSKLYEKFSGLKGLWMWFRSQHIVVKILLVAIGLVMLGFILYFVFKSIKKAFEVIRKFIRRGDDTEIKEVLERADQDQIVAGAVIISGSITATEKLSNLLD